MNYKKLIYYAIKNYAIVCETEEQGWKVINFLNNINVNTTLNWCDGRQKVFYLENGNCCHSSSKDKEEIKYEDFKELIFDFGLINLFAPNL
jgi:hypothetical protein